jgi:hypothetical protein
MNYLPRAGFKPQSWSWVARIAGLSPQHSPSAFIFKPYFIREVVLSQFLAVILFSSPFPVKDPKSQAPMTQRPISLEFSPVDYIAFLLHSKIMDSLFCFWNCFFFFLHSIVAICVGHREWSTHTFTIPPKLEVQCTQELKFLHYILKSFIFLDLWQDFPFYWPLLFRGKKLTYTSRSQF